MRKLGIASTCFFVCTLLPGCIYHTGPYRAAEEIGIPSQWLSEKNPLQLLLSHLRLSEGDLAISPPEDNIDPYVLKKTIIFLNNPLTIDGYTEHLSGPLERNRNALAQLLTRAVSELEIDLTPAPAAHDSALLAAEGMNILPGISAEAKGVIMELLQTIITCRSDMNNAFAELSLGEILFLKNYFSEMLLKDKMMQFKGNAGRVAAQTTTPLKSDQHNTKTLSFFLPTKIRSADFYRATIKLADAIDRLLEQKDRLGGMKGGIAPMESGELKGDIIASENTPWGTIIIGGAGSTCYSTISALLIIDLGGDDEYHNIVAYPSFTPFNAAAGVIIDLAGNDLYRSTKKFTQGSAAFGCSFLVDCSGDDTYLAADFSQGCGFFGVGVLDDRKGNDRYRADTMAQGAAAFGIGMLSERAGNDSYHGSLYNQGSAFTGGLGFVIEAQGDDTFFAGGTYPDSREAEGAFVSFSQGCGFGDRQYASGGLGILWNGGGNDHYGGSYFAQGAGYWLGTGLLIDRAGSDSYSARRYAQGTATHRAVGALVDASGNDVYASWGASQGCGYDFAQGIISDGGGDDRYNATWFAQGVGGKAGVGILVDRGGNDSYRSGHFCSQGNGQYWDEEKAGSIGMVIDLGGKDAYSGAGKPNCLWRQGTYGGGVDTSARMKPLPWPEIYRSRRPAQEHEPGRLELFKHVDPLPELEMDLNHEDVRQAAVQRLAAAGPAVIPRLLEYVRINDVQLSFTVREIIASMGRDAAPLLREELKDHAHEPLICSFILSLLGDLKDENSRETFLSFMQYADGSVRTAAMRGISRIAHGFPAATLLPAAADERPEVRKFCAIALGICREAAAIKTLAALLADDHYAVRFAAFEALQGTRNEAAPYLLAMRNHHEGYPEYARELAGELLEDTGAADLQPGIPLKGKP